MSQNRDAPAYQEYAASMMAKLPYRTMTLHERGLLYTMRQECWVNSMLPRSPSALAKVLGYSADEITQSLPAVMPFFEVREDFIFSPELEDYRAYLDDQKERMANGGKKGAAATNSKRKHSVKIVNIDDSTTSATAPQLPRQPSRRGKSEVLDKSSTEKPSQTQSPEKGVVTDPFVAAYEAAESCTAEAYAKAKGGG